MTSDAQLLRDYAEAKSQDAFTELVRRHLDLVYSAALRQVRSPQLAEEISQSVFADLARAADKLKPDTVLTAWLYQIARRTAIDVIRRESRRQARERLAVEMAAMNTATDWNHIAPLLEDAMEALEETDRAAILLRYFENKSLREVGQSLGTSDDAAQKRVSRAVERLREFFAKRGVTVGASGLVLVLSANAVQAAPAGLAITISTAALAGTAITASTVLAATTKTIAMTTLQKTLVAATVVVLTSAGIYEARQAAQLHDQVQTLQQRQAPMAQETRQLQNSFANATNQLASLLAENALLKSNSNQAELLRLRGEVTRLREANARTAEADSTTSLMKSWLAREERLKQIVDQYPDKRTPDMQLLSEQDWLNQAKDANFDTDKSIQRTLANLRNAAGNKFAQIASEAVTKYMTANHNQFPTDLAQLQPYFNTPVSDAILSRWEIVPQSAYPNQGMGGDWVIAVKAPVDRELDSSIVIGAGNYGSSDYRSVDMQKAIVSLTPALKAYAADHAGAQPGIPAGIRPYLTTPEQQAAFDYVMQHSSPKKN